MSDIRKYITILENAEILDESFKTAQEKFSVAHEDEHEVKEYIEQFKDLAKRNIIKGQDKDIGKWIKAGWDEFKVFIDKNATIKSNRMKKNISKKNVIEIYNKNGIKVVIPLTKSSSCLYGSNTKWCTAGKEDNKFNYYFKQNNVALIYVLYGRMKMAIAVQLNDLDSGIYEIFDEEDTSVDRADFMEFVDNNVTPENLIALVKPHKDELLSYSLSDDLKNMIYSLNLKKPVDEHVIVNITDEEIMDYIATDALLSYKFIVYTGSERLRTELEDSIATNARISVQYAIHVLNGRFKKGEDSISKDPRESAAYAKSVIKGRFKKGEPAILTIPHYALFYAKDVIGGKFEEGEDIIIKGGAKYAYAYATLISKERFEQAEDMLSRELDDKSKQVYNKMFDANL